MIFTFPAIFYALFFSDPVSRPSENGNLSSSKRGEKTDSNDRIDQPKK
jgi:hypothetical protein